MIPDAAEVYLALFRATRGNERLRIWLGSHRHTLGSVISPVLWAAEEAERLARLPPVMDGNSVDAILSQVAAKPPKYSSGNAFNDATIRAFRDAGSEDTVVATGGYRLIVQHYRGTLISILPKAKSAIPQFGAYGLTIWPYPPKKWDMRTYGGRLYYTPSDGSSRLRDATRLAADAFERAGGDVRLFYEALGSSGQCAICGASLSDPLSQARGIGPECIKKIEAPIYMAILDEEKRAQLGLPVRR